ncbi:MAG: hypothetical protein ACLVJH_11450 [Faecalibacterium prausnitzii]
MALAALASGNYEVMAAVMVGGMVPPIAIALSTTFCPKKWTADERRNGIVNYVMGLCFVTEGAIPLCSSRPAARPAQLCGRCRAGRCALHDLRLRPARTRTAASSCSQSWTIPCSVLCGAGCWQRAGCCDPEPAQENRTDAE